LPQISSPTGALSREHTTLLQKSLKKVLLFTLNKAHRASHILGIHWQTRSVKVIDRYFAQQRTKFGRKKLQALCYLQDCLGMWQ
jgi:hypothetical protein